MKRNTEEKPQLLKWYTYSQAKRDAIMDAFWRDYFAKYPDPGSLDELNALRKRYQRPVYVPRFALDDNHLIYENKPQLRSQASRILRRVLQGISPHAQGLPIVSRFLSTFHG